MSRERVRAGMPIVVRAVAAALVPFAILLCDPRSELAATAACLAVLVLPGSLLVAGTLPAFHPLRAWPARLGLSTAGGLLLFGSVAAVAGKAHLSLSTFLALFGVVYALACVLGVGLLLRGPVSCADADGSETSAPLERPGRWVGLAWLALAAVTLAAVPLGAESAARSWWPATLAGALAGAAAWALAVRVIGRERAHGTRRLENGGSTPPSGERGTEALRSRSESIVAALLWSGVACVSLYLMQAAYRTPRWNNDDVTYVSQAVDDLADVPIDRFEPSLGQGLAMDPAFVLPTVTLLAASIGRVTGVSCAALQHSTLLPFFVLAGISSLAGLLGVLLSRQRLLVPLALLLALLPLLRGDDGDLSLVNFLVARAAQPKSVHLALLLPLQLASLLLVVLCPGARHVWLAVALSVAGHLVHPWSTAAGMIAVGALLAYALCAQPDALKRLAMVAASLALLGGLHAWFAHSAFLGAGASIARTPELPLELARAGAGVAPRLDAAVTFGAYGELRLGALGLAWTFLMGRFRRACRLFALVAVAALVIAYVEPVGRLYALVMETSLLWRTRWLVSGLIGGAMIGLGIQRATVSVVSGRVARGTAEVLGVAVALGALLLMVSFSTGAPLARGEPVGELSKLSPATHALAEELGGFEARAFVLLPEPESSRLSSEICQLVPRVRLVISREQVIQWFLGQPELDRRLALLRRFYGGSMGPSDFSELRREFPVDFVIVDHSGGHGDAQTRLLRAVGWQAGRRFGRDEGRYELWRAPAGS